MTQQLTKDDLRGCPFCGGLGEIEEIESGCFGVGCTDCDFQLMNGSIGLGWHKSESDAVRTWNERNSDLCIQGLQDWTKKLQSSLDAASKRIAELEQGKCLHQIAEPAAVHPDDVAVDALAALMKAKLAKQRGKGYGGWDTDCTQQRLSDLLRGHVDKGDPVDVANFCAFLLARGEGIAAAPQAVQPAVPNGWVPCVITYEGQHHEEIAYGPQVMMDRLKKWLDRYFEMRAAPAHPAEGVPAPMEGPGILFHCERATQPAAQGLDAQQYRLIDHGELIEAGDEFLMDDFMTWEIDPKGIFVGTPLGIAFRPARRAIAAQAKHGVPDDQ